MHSGEKTPNCTFLTLLSLQGECEKFNLGFDIASLYQLKL
jgi:hypothetical protein